MPQRECGGRRTRVAVSFLMTCGLFGWRSQGSRLDGLHPCLLTLTSLASLVDAI